MKKMLCCLSFGVMCASLALAQDAPAPTATPVDASATASSIQGCLSGADGKYTLTQDGTSMSYKLVGTDEQLKKHVGHEVAVSGAVTGSAASASAVSAQGQTQPTSATAAGNSIQVTDVKMVSEKCSAAPDATPSK